MEGFAVGSLLVVAWTAAWLLVVVGLAGALLPALPGTPVILAGLVLMAWLDGFVRVSIPTLAGLAALVLLSVVIDFAATAEGARRFGAGRAAILGATLGLLVGLFFGLPGMLLGPFAGAVIGHRLGEAEMNASIRAGFGASIGVLVGTAAKVAISAVMLAWFALAWWLD